MCKTYLLTDLAAFEATEPCGGTPSGSTASLVDAKPGSVEKMCDYYPASSAFVSTYEIPDGCEYYPGN